MKNLLLPLCLFAVACGGSIDTSMSGGYHGSSTLTLAGSTPFAGIGFLAIAASGTTATISQVCPNGDGSAVADGVGSTAEWHGNLVCTPVHFADCTSVVPTITSGSIRLNADKSLHADAAGTAFGCSLTRAFTMTFDGTK
jgi:hypothetical protein